MRRPAELAARLLSGTRCGFDSSTTHQLFGGTKCRGTQSAPRSGQDRRRPERGRQRVRSVQLQGCSPGHRVRVHQDARRSGVLDDLPHGRTKVRLEGREDPADHRDVAA